MHGPSLSAKAVQAPGFIFSNTADKKNVFYSEENQHQSSIQVPLVTRGSLLTHWTPAVIRGSLVSWAPGRLGPPGTW